MRAICETTAVLVAMALTVTACGGDERRPARAPASTTSTTSAALTTSDSSSVAQGPSTHAAMLNYATPKATPVGITSAVMRVTMARCDRQTACNNVGTNRTFGDRDACANEIGHEVVAALPSEECPSGVDADNLATCVSDLQSEPCRDKAPSAEGPSSCGLERLCARP